MQVHVIETKHHSMMRFTWVADLLKALLTFRQLPIVLCADIEKAYLQYEIAPEH